MTTELFALGEYVSNHNGRLSIIDTFDAIQAEHFPWRAYFGIAVKISVAPDDTSREMLYMRIVSDNGKTVLFETSTKLTQPADKKGGKLVIASNVKGLIFPEPGLYHFCIMADAERITDYVFEVKSSKKEEK